MTSVRLQLFIISIALLDQGDNMFDLWKIEIVPPFGLKSNILNLDWSNFSSVTIEVWVISNSVSILKISYTE